MQSLQMSCLQTQKHVLDYDIVAFVHHTNPSFFSTIPPHSTYRSLGFINVYPSSFSTIPHFTGPLLVIYADLQPGNMGSRTTTTPSCHVVAMPYPGRGHINPMMNLCKLLVSKSPNITISFVVTEEWLGFLSTGPKPPPSIRFETVPNVIPSEVGRALDFPGFVRAVYTKLEDPFEKVLDRVENGSPVVAIMADTALRWMVEVGNRRNILVVSLWTMSPTVFTVLNHFDILKEKGGFPVSDLSEHGDELIDYIPGLSPIRLADLPTIFYGAGKELLYDVLNAFSLVHKAQCVILSSFYELEPQVTDSLRTTLPFPVYSVGPLIPHASLSSTQAANTTDNMDYFTWLESQPSKSVLYVSLGSFLSVSRDQMDEIVAGIRASGVMYLWVARGDTERIQEACGEKGLVVQWCDQLRVLCHSSIGGFLTHCGWNSTLEGVFAGVPMLTFPILFDQVPNSKLIADDWKTGVRVKTLEGEKVVGRDEIAMIVKKFMDLDAEESKELRGRSSELKEKCRQALAKDGSSDANIDVFIRDILQCHC